VGTIRILATIVVRSIDRDERFDRRFRVDTAGVLLSPVELRHDPRFVHSNWYGPTAASTFFHMLRQVKVDFSKFVFIDFGCGKGKALLLASRLPFRQIIGIDLWSELVCIAEENLKRYTGKRKCKNYQLHCMDASEFPMPSEPSIYYFFDPFREEVMLKVLENMRCSLAAAPREVYLVYCEPDRPHVLDKSGFLTPVKQARHYSIYKASEIRANRKVCTAIIT
jgi:SAM-dependent methyltransferase